MLRKLFCAMFAMTVSLGLVAAEQKFGTINKVDGKKIVFQEYTKGKKGEKVGEPVELIAADAKVVKGKFNKEDKKFETGDAIEDGLKNKIFTDINEEKPVRVRITVEDKKVSEIMVLGGKKKKDS